MREYFAKIIERDGKKILVRVPTSAHGLEWFSKYGFLPYAGLEKPLLSRKTVAAIPVVIDGEVVVARIYENMTVKDYDRAMEDYLREVRSERGYTEREPDSYIRSSVPRWKSDAEDWDKFKDAVMLYALPILNEYIETGKAPTLAEFKAGLPKMVWKFKEES